MVFSEPSFTQGATVFNSFPHTYLSRGGGVETVCSILSVESSFSALSLFFVLQRQTPSFPDIPGMWMGVYLLVFHHRGQRQLE